MSDPVDPSKLAESEHRRTLLSDSALRRWVTWIAVAGTGGLSAFFLGFMALNAISKSQDHENWLMKLIEKQYASVIGVPMSVVSAFCLVTLLKVTHGPIEFEGAGFKFKGASGPIILWVLCFLAITGAFHLNWENGLAVIK